MKILSALFACVTIGAFLSHSPTTSSAADFGAIAAAPSPDELSLPLPEAGPTEWPEGIAGQSIETSNLSTGGEHETAHVIDTDKQDVIEADDDEEEYLGASDDTSTVTPPAPYNCQMFGEGKDGLDKLQKRIMALQQMQSLFGYLDDCLFKDGKKDGVISRDDLIKCRSELLPFLQQPVANASPVGLAGIEAIKEFLAVYAEEAAFTELALSYRDSLLPKNPNGSIDQKLWVTVADIRWMILRLEATWARCVNQDPSVVEKGKNCCLCSYDQDDEKTCRDLLYRPGKQTPEEYCEANGCQVAADGSCHDVQYSECLQMQRDKSIVIGNFGNGPAEKGLSCDSFEVRHDRDFTPLDARQFSFCENFYDVHRGHSWCGWTPVILPQRMSLALSLNPHLKKYSHVNRGCAGASDGNGGLTIGDQRLQLQTFVEQLGFQNVILSLTSNQDYSKQCVADPASIPNRPDANGVVGMCTPVEIVVTAQNGKVTTDTKVPSCDLFDNGTKCVVRDQRALCKEKDSGTIRSMICAGPAGKLRWEKYTGPN